MWGRRGGYLTAVRVHPTPPSGNNQPGTATRQVQARRNAQRDWDFHIDWSDIYKINKRLKTQLMSGKKLKKSVKLEIVRRLVRQVRNRLPGAHRSVFRQIAMDVKKKYPVTFSSELAHGKISKHSLCKSMQDRFDNVKRKKRSTTLETEAPAIKAAYGCQKWRVFSLPQGETEESLREIQEDLKNHFETVRPEVWDVEIISELMAKTFCNQRHDINEQAKLIEKARKESRRRRATEELETVLTNTEELRNKWPFLFQPRGMLEHFSVLTGVDATKVTTAYVHSEEIKKMIKFLFKTGDKESNTFQRIKRRFKNSELDDDETRQAALISLLIHRFKESKSGLFLMVDENAREDDISHLIEIPKTPRLIITGNNLFEPQKTIFFTMDSEVLGTAATLVEGFGLLFASYYVFNLEYEPKAQLTLEFIQRVIAEINPNKGNKRPNKRAAEEAGANFSARSVHPAIRRLDVKYDEFFPDVSDFSSSDCDTTDVEEDGL